MPLSPSTVPDPAVPENRKSESLEDLIGEISKGKQLEEELEARLCTVKETTAQRVVKGADLLYKKMPEDVRSLWNRAKHICFEDGDGIMRERTFYIDHKGDDEMEFGSRGSGECLSLYFKTFDDGTTTLAIQAGGKILRETSKQGKKYSFHLRLPMSEGLLEYPRVLAFFQAELTKMEDTKRAGKLSQEIKKGE